MDQLLQYLSEPWLQAILGLLGIALPIFIGISVRKRFKISYKLLSRVRVLSEKAEDTRDIKLMVNGNEEQGVFISQLKILNSGNQAISKSDYESPLKIQLPNGVTLLNCEISEQFPDNLSPHFSIENNEVVIYPILLNKRDYFLVNLLTSGGSPEGVRVIGRIKNITNVTQATEREYPLMYLSLPLIMAGSIVVFLADPNIKKGVLNWQVIGGIYLMISGYTFFAIPALRKMSNESGGLQNLFKLIRF